MKKNTFLTIIFCLSISLCFGQKLHKRIDTLIESAVSGNHFNGTVLVSHRGKIIYKKAFGEEDAETHLMNTLNTIYQAGSITKEFTAAIILKLAEQNKLTLDDKLSKFIPSYVLGDEVSIKQLLTHTAGIYDVAKNAKYIAENTKPRSRAELLGYFVNKPLDFTPGTKYGYSDGGYILLGLIIENITGKSYQEVVRSMILKPLKMKHTGFNFSGLISEDKSTGYTQAGGIKEKAPIWDSTAAFSAGSLYSTVKDLYLWHKALLRNKVYSRASLQLAVTPSLEGYGLGWRIDTLADKQIASEICDLPGFSGYFGRIQDDKSSVIVLNNIENPEIEMIGKRIFQLIIQK